MTRFVEKRWGLIVAIALTISAFTALAPTAALASPTTLDEFTQNELNNDWEADRQFPSDGVTSVSAFGRSYVARIGIDNSQTQSNQFRRTEGIKTAGVGNFGNGVHVDLYLDPSWRGIAVRAGVWVVGDNGSGARDDLFGIIEFAQNSDHLGWRVWDSNIGWVELSTPYELGDWVTLTIELDTSAELYRYSIDGVAVQTATGGENFIREVFLNSYNYGLDDQTGLVEESYSAHWHHEDIPDYKVGESTYTLCASRYSGAIRSPYNGECTGYEIELETPSLQSYTFCINYSTGQLHYDFDRGCTSRYGTHTVPDDGNLLTCVNRYTGANRWVYSHSRCTTTELPNTIPVYDPPQVVNDY